jgi:predicted PurR-regulated permease PerM
MKELVKGKYWIRALAAAFILAAFYYIRDILPPIIIAVLLFYALNPLVSRLSNKKPKGLGLPINISIFLSFLLTFLVFYLFFRFVIPPIAAEFKLFGQNIPEYITSGKQAMDSLRQWYAGYALPEEFKNIVAQSLQGILDSILGFGEEMFKGIISIATRFIQIIIIPILTYYLLKDKETLKRGVLELVPPPYQQRTTRIFFKMNKVLSGYVKGILLLCLMVGTTAGIGLYLLGVRYFIILGLIAGVTEAITFIGPWIGAVPAVLIAFLSSPALALQVIALYFAIQAIENYIFVPKVFSDQLELHPVAIILALLVLGKLLGPLGLFFAAPIVAILRIIYEEIQEG